MSQVNVASCFRSFFPLKVLFGWVKRWRRKERKVEERENPILLLIPPNSKAKHSARMMHGKMVGIVQLVEQGTENPRVTSSNLIPETSIMYRKDIHTLELAFQNIGKKKKLSWQAHWFHVLCEAHTFLPNQTKERSELGKTAKVGPFHVQFQFQTLNQTDL